MHARFLGVSRHVITWLSLLCFRLPPPPLDPKCSPANNEAGFDGTPLLLILVLGI